MNRLSIAATALFLTTLVGCADPIVGKWSGKTDDCNASITWEFDSEGKGDAELYAIPACDLTKFDLSWKADGSDYDVDLTGPADLQVSCEIDDEKLKCDGDVELEMSRDD